MLGLNIVRYFVKSTLTSRRLNKRLGKTYPRTHLRINWKNIISDKNLNYISFLGNYTYGGGQVNINRFCDDDSKISIGHCCSIAGDVNFLLGGGHNYKTVSSFPFKAILDGEGEALSKGDIVLDDDVWVGYRATILSGVHIGQGAVVAAGAVVTKDVPSYAIVGGVPAKVIKYRFSPEVIEQLMQLDYGKLTDELIHRHEKELYTPIDQKSPEEIEQLLSWFPKKETC
ncbi:CatB-related O-acetyltransferase [Lactobacillus delbrueckii subsp. lactis]